MIPRAVYDTMVFYQWAVLPKGRLHGTARAAINGSVRLCLSSTLAAEIKDLLNRPAIQARSRFLTPELVNRFLEQIVQHAEWIASVPNVFTWPEHPDDDHLFNLAIFAKARYLVTWEKRILGLSTSATKSADLLRKLAPRLTIITPTQFAAELRVAADQR
ncbi:MAG: PIN domain-containing protein [Phycisphaerales bacterium]|nr:PIN domain-containing protein [Phycisphaerales bacterium]